MMKKWVNIDGLPKDSDTSTISFNDIVRMVCRVYERGIYMDRSKKHGKLTEKYGYIALFVELKLWTMISVTSVVGKIQVL